MSKETTPVMVNLKSKPGKGKDGKVGKSKEQKFPIDQANKMLKIKKSAWELSDKDYIFNGIEIAPASKKA